MNTYISFLFPHQPPRMGSMMITQPTMMYTQPVMRSPNPFGPNPGAQVTDTCVYSIRLVCVSVHNVTIIIISEFKRSIKRSGLL